MKINILKPIGKLFIVIGVLMLMYLIFTDIYAGFEQRKLVQEWESRFKDSLLSMIPPLSENEREGETQGPSELADKRRIEVSTFARLVIPKMELDVIVVEGTTREVLKKGPGHLKGSALPGEKGNCVISGHRVTYGAPFRRLNELELDDEILIYTPSRKSPWRYTVVAKKIVKPTDVSAIKPTEDARLTLTACHPPHSARQRLIIIAELSSESEH
ncbi:MAG: sortase [Actinomycetota bacterium]|nr:sortase [Actinomycetota bacterium]